MGRLSFSRCVQVWRHDRFVDSLIYVQWHPYQTNTCSNIQVWKTTWHSSYRIIIALFQAYVGNTAWAHLLAMRALRHSPLTAGGRCFFIPDDTPVANSFTLLEPFLKARGFKLSTWSVPYYLVYGVLYVTEKVLHLMAPICKVNLSTALCSIIYINKTYYFNRKAAENILGYTPLYSYEQSLENSLDYYMKLELWQFADVDM